MFDINTDVTWENNNRIFTGKIIELKSVFAIVNCNKKNMKIPYKILTKIKKELDHNEIKYELETKGYCVIEDILNDTDIEYCIKNFTEWQNSIPNHDEFHKTSNPHNI